MKKITMAVAILMGALLLALSLGVADDVYETLDRQFGLAGAIVGAAATARWKGDASSAGALALGAFAGAMLVAVLTHLSPDPEALGYAIGEAAVRSAVLAAGVALLHYGVRGPSLSVPREEPQP